MNSTIINHHLSWITKGYGFKDIQTIRRELIELDPFLKIGTSVIQKKIGGIVPEKIISQKDLLLLTFLIVDDPDFDGDIEFLKYCRNLKQLFISGNNSIGKIENLQPLQKLHNLEYVYLERQNIIDLSPLSNLQNLKALFLYNNPIETLKPVASLSKLQYAEFSRVKEKEVAALLRNSQTCRVSFTSREEHYSYDAYWLKGWAFKITFFKDFSAIITTIEPIDLERFQNKTTKIDQEIYAELMKKTSRKIASFLLSENQKIQQTEYYYKEELCFLKGQFNYIRKSSHHQKFSGLQN